jgi:hypothetical protein
VLYAISTGAAVAGWFLVVFGGLAMVVGLLGAVKAILGEETVKPTAGWGDVIAALLKAGPWGVVAALGLACFLAGCTLLGIEVKIPTG